MVYVLCALATPYVPTLHKRSIENQINYLNRQLVSGMDNDLQIRFPEGFVFANALFALSVLEYSEIVNKNDALYATYLDRTTNRLLSDRAKRSFSKDLELPYGAFYSGWTNLVLHKYRNSRLLDYSKIKDEVITANDSLEQLMLKAQVDSIHPIDSYFGSVWPGDNLACIASLPYSADDLQKDWYASLQENSTCDSMLLDHFLRSSCELRGSSQALCHYFLSTIDREQAINSNERYRALFVEQVFGVELVKEYQGEGYMDVDSGPIVFGYGAVATIMNTKTQSSLQQGNYRWTWAWLNLAGVTVNLFGSKYYLAKKEPMFDLFMLWCSVSV